MSVWDENVNKIKKGVKQPAMWCYVLERFGRRWVGQRKLSCGLESGDRASQQIDVLRKRARDC